MLFNSWQFGIFLPVVFAIYWAVSQKFRWALLFAASYYFYMSWNVEYVILILFTTIISYFAAIFMERFQNNTAAKKIILTFTLVSCLGVLFVFKYFNFFSESFVNLMRAFSIQLTQCRYIYDERKNLVFSDVENYLHELEKKYGIKIIGGFDARNFNIADEDFIDFMHLDKAGTKIVWNTK